MVDAAPEFVLVVDVAVEELPKKAKGWIYEVPH
jgi:hypothetical protein